MHYTAQPTDLPTLATLNESVDRAQTLLDATLTDLEQHPSSSIEFRLRAIKDIIDCAYRLTAIRKTLIALRARPKENAVELRAITGMVAALHQQMQKLRPTPPPSEPGAPTPPPASGTPPSPTAASIPSTPTSPQTSQTAPPGRPTSPTAASSASTWQTHAGVSEAGLPKQSSPSGAGFPACAPDPSGVAEFSSALQCWDTSSAPQAHLDSPCGEPRESHIRTNHRPRKPRYSIKNLPTLNQLIPQATLPTPKPAPSQTAAILHHHATPQTGSAGILPASLPKLSQPETRNPQPDAMARLTRAIALRIPYTLYTSPENLPHTLPPTSHKATTYAPLLDLDLIPYVKSIPTLPITNHLTPDFSHTNTPNIPPDLTLQINEHLTTITNKTINLRADLLHLTSSKSKSTPSNEFTHPPP